jgi:hypothetical protein
VTGGFDGVGDGEHWGLRSSRPRARVYDPGSPPFLRAKNRAKCPVLLRVRPIKWLASTEVVEIRSECRSGRLSRSG